MWSEGLPARRQAHRLLLSLLVVLGGFIASQEVPVVLWSRYQKFNTSWFVEQIENLRRRVSFSYILADHHTVHRSQGTLNALRRLGVTMLWVPKRSPTLSPMDFTVWKYVERKATPKKTTTTRSVSRTGRGGK